MNLYEKWTFPESIELVSIWVNNGMTDEQIADKIGISVGTLKQWKRKNKALSAVFPKYNSDGKAFLEHYKHRWMKASKKVECLKDAVQEAKDRATRTSIRYELVKVKTTQTESMLEKSIVKAHVLEEKIIRICDVVEKEKGKVQKRINRVQNPADAKLLSLVYIQGKELDEASQGFDFETHAAAKRRMQIALLQFEAVNPDLVELIKKRKTVNT